MESTTEKEACALLQLLEQLHQLLTNYAAVPARPEFVGPAYEALRTSDSTEREEPEDRIAAQFPRG